MQIEQYREGEDQEEAAGTVKLARFSLNGQEFMALDTYPFSEKFGWVADKYGVSWQVNLEKN